MGYERIQTYILETEPGTSLRAAGWTCEGSTRSNTWTRAARPERRTDQPTGPKSRWAKTLNAAQPPVTKQLVAPAETFDGLFTETDYAL